MKNPKIEIPQSNNKNRLMTTKMIQKQDQAESKQKAIESFMIINEIIYIDIQSVIQALMKTVTMIVKLRHLYGVHVAHLI